MNNKQTYRAKRLAERNMKKKDKNRGVISRIDRLVSFEYET